MPKRAVINELLNEQACAHSATKSSACNKQAPGATSGGCAFEGAQISLFPYADAAHLVHGPLTCLAASWETRATLTSVAGTDFTQMGFSTALSLSDVVLGSEQKLWQAIAYIMEHYQPAALFVYSTCVSALIGDDIDSLCRKAQDHYAIPVVAVHAPGFVGGKNLGSRLAGEAVLNQLIGTLEPAVSQPFSINLIGEYNVTGDMWQYTPLLKELGIHVQSTLSGDGRIEHIRSAHRAQLNVIVCAKSLISLTRKMEQKYAIPYISVSFYGRRDTSAALRDIATALGDAELLARCERLIAREEQQLEQQLAPYRALFRGKKAVLNTGGNKSWSIASALQDLGIEVVATSVRKATESDKEKARHYLGENGILMTNPASEQARIIEERHADILLAGGRSLYTAIKKKIAFIDVNQEKKRSYGGYGGLLNLAQDLKNALQNPVFRCVSTEAPWQNR